jgi:hypothetical protein
VASLFREKNTSGWFIGVDDAATVPLLNFGVCQRRRGERDEVWKTARVQNIDAVCIAFH